MILPVDFTNRMREYLQEDYEDFISSYDGPEIKGIRLNKIAPGHVLGALSHAEEVENTDNTNNTDNTVDKGYLNVFSQIPWNGNGFSYINEQVRPGKHPYHEAGAYYIQEPSAMAPVTYLDVKRGERVLDLCAAPGGKSSQIGAALEGEGILVANEIMPDRVKILSENIERMGIGNALVISEDPRNISDRFMGYFDKILVDAPCSGEGMFRRSETAVNEWSLNNVDICAKRQEWILDEAAKMLREGGRMVYSTCTFAREEDEEQISSFLSRHDDFRLGEMKLYGGMQRGFSQIGVRLWPHLVNGEGHYVCVLEKKTAGDIENDELNTYRIPPAYGYESDLSKKDKSDLKDMYDFFEKNILIKDFFEGRRLTRFKDQIYMLPEDCPSLRGMKVIRPGLHLGTILKNRFEPGHALSRVLKAEQVTNSLNLSINDKEIYKYINGETFNISLSNGWCLIFVDNFPIGWGKITNEIMKNHYPKGLRKQLC